MTKKDFALIAKTINGLRYTATPPEDLPLIAMIFADALTTTNPRFDRNKFINACIGKTEKK